MDELWACLAAMAVFGQDLNTAEVAYAMIHEVRYFVKRNIRTVSYSSMFHIQPAKVQYICYIRDLPTPESRAAELALFRRQPREAENILLQAGQVYRAIMMWINVFQWERALDIATKYKAHADMVIYFRDKYLQTIGRKENNKRFIQVGQGVKESIKCVRVCLIYYPDYSSSTADGNRSRKDQGDDASRRGKVKESSLKINSSAKNYWETPFVLLSCAFPSQSATTLTSFKDS